MAGDKHQQSHPADVSHRISELLQQIEGLRGVSAPNREINDFALPASEDFDRWRKKVLSAQKDNLIVIAIDILDDISVPAIEAESPDHDHLIIFHRMSRLKASVEALVVSAQRAGYPNAASAYARSEDVLPEITEIRTILSQVKSAVEALESQDGKIIDGISISLGPVSFSLGAIKATLERAKSLIPTSGDIDVGNLSVKLSKLSEISKEFASEVRAKYPSLPSFVTTTIKEIKALATIVAQKGVDLLRKVITTGQPESSERDSADGPASAPILTKKVPASDVALDLGTAMTRIYLRGHGVVLNEPTAVTLRSFQGRKEVYAVGADALELFGRTASDMVTIRPVSEGAIADHELIEEMLKIFLNKKMKRPAFRVPDFLVSTPAGSTDMERRALKRAILAIGSTRVVLVDQLKAACLGADISFDGPDGVALASIGAGVSEFGILAASELVYHHSVRVGGDQMNWAIQGYLRRQWNLGIGERTAEKLKLSFGGAEIMPGDESHSLTVAGRDLLNGVPKKSSINRRVVREAISEIVQTITDGFATALEMVPPELAGAILSKGIILVGGGAELPNIDAVISRRLRLPVRIAPSPSLSVIRGMGIMISDRSKKNRYSIRA